MHSVSGNGCNNRDFVLHLKAKLVKKLKSSIFTNRILSKTGLGGLEVCKKIFADNGCGNTCREEYVVL